MPHGVPLDADQLVTSLGLAAAAGLAAHLVLRPGPLLTRRHRPALGIAALALAAAGLVGSATPAAAHDPGQGAPRGDADLAVTVEDRTARLDVVVAPWAPAADDCARLGRPTVVARRAGMVRSAPMTAGGSCHFTGEVTVPEDGRWFVYATFTTPEGPYETWLPVDVTDGAEAQGTRPLYEPPERSGGAGQVLGGEVLVVMAVVLLAGSLRAVARFGPEPVTTT